MPRKDFDVLDDSKCAKCLYKNMKSATALKWECLLTLSRSPTRSSYLLRLLMYPCSMSGTTWTITGVSFSGKPWTNRSHFIILNHIFASWTTYLSRESSYKSLKLLFGNIQDFLRILKGYTLVLRSEVRLKNSLIGCCLRRRQILGRGVHSSADSLNISIIYNNNFWRK